MHDPREHGHAVAFNSAGELPLAHARKVSEGGSALLFHIGSGGLPAFIANLAVEPAFKAGETIVAVCSEAEEAFDLRGRVRLAAREGFAALQRGIIR